MRSVLIGLGAWLATSAPIGAQDTACEPEGVVLIGEPSEVLTWGQRVVHEALDPDESEEYQLVVSCVDGSYVHASRENRPLILAQSGCYEIFVDPIGSGYIAVDADSPTCKGLSRPGADLRYSEVLRNGVHLLTSLLLALLLLLLGHELLKRIRVASEGKCEKGDASR